ncbi:MAG: hypothetical protein WAL75_19865, partial [Terracidiphilus sp.]
MPELNYTLNREPQSRVELGCLAGGAQSSRPGVELECTSGSPGQSHFKVWEEFVLKGHGFSRAVKS